ncbi:hypothetical protein MNBD_GAMMA12-2269 [hydrothermal vent metagenome]|uniref:Uncharacterized protein n=1 Tax=hydrothermal vent metagenome TaxID=652676 RepID=A0A3B0Y747_9ZZZZ
MCGSCNVRIDDVWLRLRTNQVYRTPDHERGVTFLLSEVNEASIEILPQELVINRVCFSDVVHYLRYYQHYDTNPCTINSNDDPNLSGDLCLTARVRNHNERRCINYILPILQNHGLAGIDCTEPNTTWLVSRGA